jgi:hypothetical protein
MRTHSFYDVGIEKTAEERFNRNSFYDVIEDDMTEEERYNYMRLIGMPTKEQVEKFMEVLKKEESNEQCNK